MVIKDFNSIYKGKNVLVTGHTGFKGSWMCLWLELLGAEVYGLSLEPSTDPSHWQSLNLNSVNHYVGDIRDEIFLKKVLKKSNPDIIFHLAAQPLVRESYLDPMLTWSTNLTGTLNLLENARRLENLKAMVIVTTDKCYENKENNKAYKEVDRLGGHDPYSSSKASIELLTTSYRKSFFNKEYSPLIATARAGNVIGGGDWSKDRLVPDLIKSLVADKQLIIRFPNASRPWQHVLDCVCGYLQLGERLMTGDRNFAEAWNFGPSVGDTCTVHDILEKFKKFWPDIGWSVDDIENPHEANLLQLDCEKAEKYLNWQSILSLDETLEMTAQWYECFLNNKTVISKQQISDYRFFAVKKNAFWLEKNENTVTSHQ